MSYDGPLPQVINAGGSGKSSFTAYAVITGGTSSTAAFQNVSGLGASGQVLTSNGAAALPTWQPASGGSGIATINGDNGSVTGSTITLQSGVSTLNSGSSVTFSGSSATMTFNVTDANNNTIIGNGAGHASVTGTNNTALGSLALATNVTGTSSTAIGAQALNVALGSFNVAVGYQAMLVNSTSQGLAVVGAQAASSQTGGDGTTAIGYSAFGSLLTGSQNIGIGYNVGANYAGSESSNILIGSPGVAAESHIIRIGTQGTGTQQQNVCYIAGIEGATYSAGTPTPAFTYVDTSNGQLLGNATTASNTVTSNFGSLVVGTGRQNTAKYALHVNVSIVVTAATGATITLGVGSTSTPTVNTVVTTFSTAAATYFTFSAIVPSRYYMLVNTTGTITVGSITTQACGL